MINGCSLVLNSLKGCSIYRVSEKLVVSNYYAQKLSFSVNRSVQAVDCMELVVTAQFDIFNGSFSENWDIQSTGCG